MLLLWLACTSETGITEGEPRLVLPVDELDFDEVVVGSQVTLSFDVENAGIGVLELETPSVEGVGFSVTEWPAEIGARSEEPLSLRFAPTEVGPVEGEVLIESNDVDAPHRLRLVAEGVEPHIDVDPETLWFGDVAEGGEVTLPVDVVARGQGRFRIDALELATDAFSVALPEGVELPHKLESGNGIELSVTFHSDGGTWDEDLLIASNDPDDSVVAVRLLANSEEAGGAPEVEITSPDHGNYVSEDEVVLLEGVAIDDGGPENLLVAWYADSALLGSSNADAGGYVSLETTLPVGEVRVTLRAVDGTGQSGEDSVEVTCWDDDEPASYVLSGGSSIFDHWSVDDDVVVTVNGATVMSDTDGSKSSHAPLAFEAKVGDTVRIVATDNNFCEKNLDALVLHWGTDSSQELNESVCVSSCPEDACYDPDYSGPWPNDFFDESYVISIP